MFPENNKVPNLLAMDPLVLLPRIYTDGSGRLPDVSITAILYAHEIVSEPIEVGSGQSVAPFSLNKQKDTTPYP